MSQPIAIPRTRSNTVSTVETMSPITPQNYYTSQSQPATQPVAGPTAQARNSKSGTGYNGLTARSPLLMSTYTINAKDSQPFERSLAAHFAALSAQRRATQASIPSPPAFMDVDNRSTTSVNGIASLPFATHRRMQSASWLPDHKADTGKPQAQVPASTTTGLFRRLSMGQSAGSLLLNRTGSISATSSPIKKDYAKGDKIGFSPTANPTPVSATGPGFFNNPFSPFHDTDPSDWMDEDSSFSFMEQPRGRTARRESDNPPKRRLSPTTERIIQGHFGF